MQKRSTYNGVIGQWYVNNYEDLLERDIFKGGTIMTGISKMLLTSTLELSIPMRGVFIGVSLEQGYPIIYQHLMYRGATQNKVDFK
jgi:hypothetical protein